jgi:hypothetical protein
MRKSIVGGFPFFDQNMVPPNFDTLDMLWTWLFPLNSSWNRNVSN